MIDAINSALSGLTRASKQVDDSAQSIASSPSQERIIEDIVDIKVAETTYKANVATLKTVDDMNKELLKIFDKRV